jgi:hypothetical protein
MINKIKNNKFGNWIFKKKEQVHYGEVLENILQILLTFQVRIKNSNYVGKEKDLQNIEDMIIDLDELLNLLEEEEKTSHIRSKEYLKKQKEFFQNFNDKIPSIYI